jgi:2-polyprenyl-3-methyl-5-hydroxy-6-metoxy-1,4-benzoquinol methylase
MIGMTQGNKCPLCGSPQVSQVVHLGRQAIRSCQNCTNAWTDPAPGAIDYAVENFHQYASGESHPKARRTLADLPGQWRDSVTMQVNLLNRSLKPNARILEIGCGEGILLEQLKLRGFDVVGIEPSDEASEIARSAGLNVKTGYFPETNIDGTVSTVIMTHVLEHLADPLKILAHVERVAPNGKLLLVQTNWRGLVPRLRRAGWYAWMPHQHFWHFTPRGLALLLEKLNWRTEHLEYSSLVHHRMLWLSNFATRIAGWGDQFHLLAQIPSRTNQVNA